MQVTNVFVELKMVKNHYFLLQLFYQSYKLVKTWYLPNAAVITLS